MTMESPVSDSVVFYIRFDLKGVPKLHFHNIEKFENIYIRAPVLLSYNVMIVRNTFYAHN